MTPADIVVGLLETVLVVYGIVESKALAPLRIGFEAGAKLWGLPYWSGFLHCPFCVGFWVALIIGRLRGQDINTVLLLPSLFVSFLLLKRDLYRPSQAAEQDAAAALIEGSSRP